MADKNNNRPTALTVFNDGEGAGKFPILVNDATVITEAMQSLALNMGTRKLTIRNLQQVKMPTGGRTEWDYPTINGVESRKAIECVIVGVGTPRVFFESEFGKGERGAPPECVSSDGITGDGLYGVNGERARVGPQGAGSVRRIAGDCLMCPMNQWPPRGVAGRKKPCAELTNLFFLAADEESILPKYIRVTPGSKQSTEDFLIQLGGTLVGGLTMPYYAAVIEVSLARQKSGGGFDYAQTAYRLVGRLSPSETAKMRAIAEGIAHLLGDTTIDRGDVEGVTSRDTDDATEGEYTVVN